jgi:aspartate 1-decarboxylase
VDIDYEGSLSIDATLLEAAGILPHERIEVYNITNGSRFATYAIRGPAGSGMIGVNGAAAHLANPGDRVIIASYVQLTPEEAAQHQPAIVRLDDTNAIARGPA